MAKYINADKLKEKKIYSEERHEYIIPVAEVDWAPIADVREVKHGKWLPYRFGLEVTKCSICKAVYEGGDSFGFCPKCGAKMDGDEPIDGPKGEHK